MFKGELGLTVCMNTLSFYHYTTERTLFVSESSSQRRIVRKHLETNNQTILTYGNVVYDIDIMNDKLLIVEKIDGLRAVSKDASGPVDSQEVNTTGLELCSTYHSIHVVQGMCLELIS